MRALQARSLRKTYGSGKTQVPVLHGMDLDIERGEFVSIMGPSGSGKSTLLHLLGLLDSPTSGTVRLLGRDVSTLRRNGRALARRESLGFVFQAFHLLPRVSALHNVMLPMAIAGVPRKKRRRRALGVLSTLGLADRARHKPSELSGGQKQRVAIARALALDPPVLLADEPTGNLDSQTSRQLMALFRHLHEQGRTIVQVTHDPTMARYADRILHIQDGRIVRIRRRPGHAGGAGNIAEEEAGPRRGGRGAVPQAGQEPPGEDEEWGDEGLRFDVEEEA